MHVAKAEDFLQNLLRENSEVCREEAAMSGREASPRLPHQFDLVFLDADKKSYLKYVETLIGEPLVGEPLNGASHVASSGGCGVASDPPIVQSLLADNALIVTDNTLWKGLVLELVMRNNIKTSIFQLVLKF